MGKGFPTFQASFGDLIFSAALFQFPIREILLLRQADMEKASMLREFYEKGRTVLPRTKRRPRARQYPLPLRRTQQNPVSR